MDLRCDDVRNLLASAGAALPLSPEKAEQVAEHLDGCAECDARLSRGVAEVLERLPVAGGPSLPAVRTLMRRQRSSLLRLAAVAAAVLAILGTGWALLRPSPASSPIVAVDAPIPDPPKFAELPELDRNILRSEGVLALYLQFCLTCLNNPTEQDRQEYLTRALLIFREVRGRIRSQYERGGADPETVTRDALNDALRVIATTKLASVTLFPSKVTAVKLLPGKQWSSEHRLGNQNYRLTLPMLPDYLNFGYLKTVLGADPALMARLEETLWSSSFVTLPKRLDEKDPTVAPKTLEVVLPLLSAKQQKLYRKIVDPK